MMRCHEFTPSAPFGFSLIPLRRGLWVFPGDLNTPAFPWLFFVPPSTYIAPSPYVNFLILSDYTPSLFPMIFPNSIPSTLDWINLLSTPNPIKTTFLQVSVGRPFGTVSSPLIRSLLSVLDS